MQGPNARPIWSLAKHLVRAYAQAYPWHSVARINQETEALLAGIVDGRTVADAAEVAGVSRRTAFRLLARPDVAERLEQLRRQTIGHAQSRLSALVDPAADALGDVLTADSGPTARVQAARAVFSQALALRGTTSRRGQQQNLVVTVAVARS